MNQVGVGSIDKVVSISRFHQLAGWRARLLVPVLTGITEFGKHDSRVTWDLSTKLVTSLVLYTSCEDQMGQDSSLLVWLKCSASSSCLLPFQIILKMITALITHCFVFEGHSVVGMGQDPQLNLSYVCITVVVSRTSIKTGAGGMTMLLNYFSGLPGVALRTQWRAAVSNHVGTECLMDLCTLKKQAFQVSSWSSSPNFLKLGLGLFSCYSLWRKHRQHLTTHH